MLSGIAFPTKAFKSLRDRPPGNVAILDVLRSVAILVVFSDHFTGEFGASEWIRRMPLVYFGWTGVDLFFVLSGFLIGSQLWKELSRTGHVRIGTFLLRRGLRIWPLYFAFVLLIAVESLFFGRDGSGLWADAAMVSNYFHHQIGGGWSLSTEEQFYILFPLVLLAVARFLKQEHMFLLPVAGLLLLPAARWLTIRHGGMSLLVARDYMYSPIHTHSDGLALGALLAWLAVVRPNLISSARRRTLTSLAMLLVGTLLYAVNREVFKYLSLAFIFGAPVLLGGIRQGGYPLPRLLNWHGFYIVSRLSYGIYLNHFGLIPRISPSLGFLHAFGDAGYLAAFTVAFGACAAFAALTFALIEWPFLRLREQWSKSRNAAGTGEIPHDPHRFAN